MTRFERMHLTGALSNPQAAPRLEAAARAHAAAAALIPDQDMPRPRLRPRMGTIQNAVLAVLNEADEPLRPYDIRVRVRRRLPVPVSYDTVASFVSVAARDPSSGVVRLRYGLYSV